jgi:hypothetical protein
MAAFAQWTVSYPSLFWTTFFIKVPYVGNKNADV